MPEEAKAWGNAQDMLTSGRCAERESRESEATSQNTGSPEPDGGLARASPGRKVQRHVFRLQKRIYQATQRGDVRTVRKLQNLLSKSWYARLLAVRRVTQDNRGQTHGGDRRGEIVQPRPTIAAGRRAPAHDKATPLRRIWIPKRGTSEKRPLGIPTLHERARQTLVRQALEPEWEAKLSAHFYGFRPGTVLLGCHCSGLSTHQISTPAYAQGRYFEVF